MFSIKEEEEVEEEVSEEEEEESDEVAQGGSSSHHKDNNNNNNNSAKKQSVPAVGVQRPVLQRRFAVDPENNHKAGVPIHHHPHHPHPHEPHPPPPAVAAPACPPTITESRRGPTEGGGSTTGVHRPLQRSATLPANPQRNVTLQLANKHRIVHFCNAVSNIIIVCPFRFCLSLN